MKKIHPIFSDIVTSPAYKICFIVLNLLIFFVHFQESINTLGGEIAKMAKWKIPLYGQKSLHSWRLQIRKFRFIDWKPPLSDLSVLFLPFWYGFDFLLGVHVLYPSNKLFRVNWSLSWAVVPFYCFLNIILGQWLTVFLSLMNCCCCSVIKKK